jgi:hypothetical protein
MNAQTIDVTDRKVNIRKSGPNWLTIIRAERAPLAGDTLIAKQGRFLVAEVSEPYELSGIRVVGMRMRTHR